MKNDAQTMQQGLQKTPLAWHESKGSCLRVLRNGSANDLVFLPSSCRAAMSRFFEGRSSVFSLPDHSFASWSSSASTRAHSITASHCDWRSPCTVARGSSVALFGRSGLSARVGAGVSGTCGA